jgi:hypothetical protein
MIYCFKCEEHGEFDVDLPEPAQEYVCPVCGMVSKRVFAVWVEKHRTVDDWMKDEGKRKDRSQV